MKFQTPRIILSSSRKKVPGGLEVVGGSMRLIKIMLNPTTIEVRLSFDNIWCLISCNEGGVVDIH